jgi:hypothetical protein
MSAATEGDRPVTNEALLESGDQSMLESGVVETPTQDLQEMQFFLQGELNRVKSIRDVATVFTIAGGTGVLYTASALIYSHVNQIISSEMDIWAKTASIAAFAIGAIGVFKSNSNAHSIEDSISKLSPRVSDDETYTAEIYEQPQTAQLESYSSDREQSPVYFE